MIQEFLRHHRSGLKWLSIAFIIKLSLFIFFAISFYHYWPKYRIVNVIFNASGDTSGYYLPLESFVQGNGYNSMARMPGLLPIYTLLRLFFSVEWTKTFIIVLQFLTGVVSVYILAKTAKLVFKKNSIFYITFFLYAFSSFVSIWDHVGYSDSFAASFLIFSIYFLIRYKNTNTFKYLFWSGFFIVWSTFFRPIHGLVIPVVVLFFLLGFKNFSRTIKAGFIYALPIVFFLGVWTYKNYLDYNRIIVLQGPMTESFSGITKQMISIRNLIIAWGGDTQPWSRGSDAEWFFTNKEGPDMSEPETKNMYTSAYTLDSLRMLRKNYSACADTSLSPEAIAVLKNQVISTAERYLASYKKEHFFKYAVINKLILAKRLLIPARLDDLPFPTLKNMNLIQKIMKGGYFLLLILVNVLGVIGCFLALRKKIFLALIPLAFLFILIAIFGYVEQRYLVPSYCFLVIFVAYLLDLCYEWYRQRKEMKRPTVFES